MIDWTGLFGVSVQPLELFIRGTSIYWFLFLLFRFVMRRDVGSIAIADILLLVLIADAAQNAMAGGYDTITEGILLVATIAGWNYLLDWLAYRFAVVRKWVEPPPLPLVRQGRFLRGNMRKEMISVDELNAQLRQQGIQRPEEVELAIMESDGTVSVIRVEGAATASRTEQRPVP